MRTVGGVLETAFFVDGKGTVSRARRLEKGTTTEPKAGMSEYNFTDVTVQGIKNI